jgi:hypothetical protein
LQVGVVGLQMRQVVKAGLHGPAEQGDGPAGVVFGEFFALRGGCLGVLLDGSDAQDVDAARVGQDGGGGLLRLSQRGGPAGFGLMTKEIRSWIAPAP